MTATIFDDIFDYRRCHFSHLLRAGIESVDSLLVDSIRLLGNIHLVVSLLIKRQLHTERSEHIHREVLIVVGSAVTLHDILDRFINHIHDIDADAFAHQRVVAARINHLALSIHHVIVFKETLTDAEVVFFHTLLRVFD